MSFFYEYETEPFTLELTPKTALENFEHFVVSIGNPGETPLNKTDEELSYDIEKGEIYLWLSQEETARYEQGKTLLQVNIYYKNGERDVSEQVPIKVYDNLYKEIMH